MAGFASELLTLRVRTIYTTDPRPELIEKSNRQRLFALSRAYARYLDRRLEQPEPRDLFGGMTTFHELAEQAAELRARAAEEGPEQEILARIERESTRVVQEIFHPRRRAWIRQSQARADAPAMDEVAVEEAAMAPAQHGSVQRVAVLGGAGAASPSPAPTSALELLGELDDLDGLDDLPDIGEGPMMLSTINEDIPAHEDPAHELTEIDPEWHRKLIAANAAWDNELFADGQTTLSGVDPGLLPAELQVSRQYPPLELSRRQELLLQSALELGTDIVALHTSLSLTGDVVTRISPHVPEDQRALFLALHKDGTANAMSHWSSIIQALQTLLSGVLGAALRRPEDGA